MDILLVFEIARQFLPLFKRPELTGGSVKCGLLYIWPKTRRWLKKLKAILEAEGILVKLNPVSQKEKNDNYFEVSVPEGEVEEAHSIIIEKGF